MHILIRKLTALHSLSEEEQRAMVAAVGHPHPVRRGDDIVPDGSEPEQSTVIIDGIACRYKLLSDGRRQILSFQYPGDVTDLYSYVLKKLDHAMGAVTDCMVAHIPHRRIADLCNSYPNLAYALWRDTLVDTSKLHSAIVNVGRRTSKERLAHFICEQVYRLGAVGLATIDRPISLPITQTDLADTIGLSLVHVNKTMKKLKDEGLIEWNAKQLKILNWKELKDVAGFDPTFLHFKTGHA